MKKVKVPPALDQQLNPRGQAVDLSFACATIYLGLEKIGPEGLRSCDLAP